LRRPHSSKVGRRVAGDQLALVLVPQFASSEPDLQPGLYYHSYHSGDDWMHHGPFATLAECEAAAEAHHVERDTVAARCRFHPVWLLMSTVPELGGWADEATYTSQEECLKVIKDHAQEVANSGFHWECFHEQHQPPAPSSNTAPAVRFNKPVKKPARQAR